MFDSPPSSSYSFHGSNSSHSKDNGCGRSDVSLWQQGLTFSPMYNRSGGRTYHVPNYATRSDNKTFSGASPQTETGHSYANERSKLINVSFDEDKGTKRIGIPIIIMFFLMLALPILLIASSGQPTIWSLPHLQTIYDRGATDTRESEHFQQQNKLFTEKERASQDPELRGEVDKYQQADRNGGEAVRHPENVDLHRTWHQYWDNPQPAKHCFSYGRREYTATLRNVPFFADWTEACKKTKVEIRGIVIEKPSYYEIKWPFGGVIGHWIVDSGEAACLPYWGSFTDKGCTAKGSRLRRVQSRLWNIQSGEDWMKMCTTAPAVVKGVNFAKPTTCDDRGLWGIYGIWEVEDLKC